MTDEDAKSLDKHALVLADNSIILRQAVLTKSAKELLTDRLNVQFTDDEDLIEKVKQLPPHKATVLRETLSDIS